MKALIFSAPALLFSVGAMAQDAPPPAAAPPAAAPEAGMEAGAATEVSETEVDAFAKAAVELQNISQQAELDETQKQTAMQAAVQAAGLAPERFNEIAQATQTDPELQQQVQVAAARHAQGAAAPSAQ